MAKRDRSKKERNLKIEELTTKLSELLEEVLDDTGIEKQQSLHAIMGGKNQTFADVYNRQITTPEEFVSIWSEGFKRETSDSPYSYSTLKNNLKYESFSEYLMLFLMRTFLREYESLSRARPVADEAFLWFGENKVRWGLFVTPKFISDDKQWVNDRSEVRHFSKKYWSIGHILKTGIVLPDKNRIQRFASAEEYLNFFVNSLVRLSGSKYELEIAERYEEYVLDSDNPEDVPLLIHEYRYGGLDKDHEHRLDFTILNEGTVTPKIAFELSPWSSHGYLAKIKGLTQKKINEMAKDNFEKEIAKQRKFFKNLGILVQIYPDDQLKNLDSVFGDIKKYLELKPKSIQLNLAILDEVFGKKVVKSHVRAV